MCFPTDADENSKPRDDAAEVAKWLLLRAREIDGCSGQLHHALTLLRLGRTRLPPPTAEVPRLGTALGALAALQVEVEDLQRLVYETGVDGGRTSLADWEAMELSERIDLLLADSGPATIVDLVQRRLLPLMRARAKKRRC